MSDLEDAFVCLWDTYCSPTIDLYPQIKPIKGRKFALDFAIPDKRIGIEIQGGTYSAGESGHKSGKGLDKDYEKANLAISHGWRIFYVSATMLTEHWVKLIETEAINSPTIPLDEFLADQVKQYEDDEDFQ